MPATQTSGAAVARRLPPKPSLEHLKNEAKQRLDQLRARAPTAKLAEAQHQLARVDQHRLAFGGDEQGRRAPLDVDEVDVEPLGRSRGTAGCPEGQCIKPAGLIKVRLHDKEDAGL